ncbi:hypothetical protein [Marimonas lutisalis]|uniref:hypothetical protein n=1 Tax=Marimonas lutisalis TaxID=2545756 RepID=UPI0010F6DF6D|nr:hypothetical protein [Marimonas lutisalis]
MNEQTQSENAGRLVARIDSGAQAECDRILAEAQDEANAIVTAARAQARDRLRAEIAELRRAGAREKAKVMSRIDTELRQLHQQQAAKAQDRGLARLCAALDALWQDQAARVAWCDQALQEAGRHLMLGAWRIEHPRNWPEVERSAILEKVETLCGVSPETCVSDAIQAGLLIRSDTAWIDATSQTLCRESTRLRALFQAELQAMMDEVQP